MMESEKDVITDKALEIIIAERIQDEVVNSDYTGYWELVRTTVLQSALNGIISGISSLEANIKNSQDPATLNSFHQTFLIRMANSETIGIAIENNYQTICSSVGSFLKGVNYDFVTNGVVVELDFKNKLMLFLNIYEKRINSGVLSARASMGFNQKKGKRV